MKYVWLCALAWFILLIMDPRLFVIIGFVVLFMAGSIGLIKNLVGK